MEVQIRGMWYKVWWHYFKNDKPLVLGEAVRHVLVPEATACVIERQYALGTLSTYQHAIVIRNKKDTPNRNTARKASLAKVLKASAFNNKERKLFWEAYHVMHPYSKKPCVR